MRAAFRDEARGGRGDGDGGGDHEVEEAEETEGPADADPGDEGLGDEGEDDGTEAGTGEDEAHCAAAMGVEVFGRDAEDWEIEHR